MFLFDLHNKARRRCHLGKEEPEAQRDEIPKVIQRAELRLKPGLLDATPGLTSVKLGDILPENRKGKRINGM